MDIEDLYNDDPPPLEPVPTRQPALDALDGDTLTDWSDSDDAIANHSTSVSADMNDSAEPDTASKITEESSRNTRKNKGKGRARQ